MAELTIPQLDFSSLGQLPKIYREAREDAEFPRLLAGLYGPQAAPQQQQNNPLSLSSLGGSPMAAAPGAAPSGYAARTEAVESGGNPFAKNPNSSASGRHQFINSTWIENFDKTFPHLAGVPPAEKLTVRDDPKYADAQNKVLNTFTSANEATLSRAGVPLTDASRYAAHFFGPGDAPKVLNAPPETPIENLVAPASIEANPFLRGKSAGQVREWLTKKMGGEPPGAQAGAGLQVLDSPQTGGMPDNIRAQLPALLANSKTRPIAMGLIHKYQNPEQWKLVRDQQGNVWQRNSATGEVKVVDKSGLLSPQEFDQKLNIAKAGATNISNVNTSGDNAYSTATNKDYGDSFVSMQKDARNSHGAITNLKVMDRLIDNPNFYSGPGSSLLLQGQKIGASLGIVDADKASATELFQKLSNKVVLDAAGGSLGAMISNTDRDFLAGTVAGLSNTPAGNKQIIQLGLKVEERKQQVAKFARDYAKSHGGKIGPDFDDALAEWAEKNPMFEKFAKNNPVLGGAKAPTQQPGAPTRSDVEAEMRRRGLLP